MGLGISFAVMLGLILVSVPIAFAIGGTASLYFLLGGNPVEIIAHTMFNSVKSYTLIAVPLYIMVGQVMNVSGVTHRLFDFAEALVGHVRGGLAHVNVLASLLFAGMSGSAAADAGGIGAVEIDAMRKRGYSEAIAVGVTAASATIAPIIPPSIVLVIYGAVADVSIGSLFAAGMLPGLIMASCLLAFIFLNSFRGRMPPPQPRASLARLSGSGRAAILPMLAPVIILGGIFGGYYTPTEAAAIAVAYSLLLGGLVYRTISLPVLLRLCRDVVVATGAVLLIAATAGMLGVIGAQAGFSGLLSDLIRGISDHPLVAILVINLILLVFGAFLDTISALFLLTPVLLPVAKEFGYDPVHFGIIMVLNLMVGTLTPPVGQVLFVLSEVTQIRFERVVFYTLPYLLPLIAALMLVCLLPDASLFLPRLIFG